MAALHRSTVGSRWRLSQQIRTGLGGIQLQRLSVADIERWHLRMRQDGLSLRTMRDAHALVARALRDGVKHGVVSRNVARDQGAPGGEPSPAVTAPNADQVRELLAKLAGDPWWYVPVVVALYTGLRRGEQLALRWSAIDLDQGKLTVREALDETRDGGVTTQAPKTAAGRRTISLPAIVVGALRSHRQAPRAFSLRWARVAARIGMPEITWHSLRHAHASMLIEAKVPITMVSARLGHADPAITLKVYARMFSHDDADAAAAIDQALGALR